ncbi:NifU family protein [Streptomyces sp. ISL-1]|uniref:NifU family protein n=1 Tax=Streptomyces sp. ISL-1 TaxID=2817657 RepID=UPI001BEAEB55|nr:NifU family protein [Streptomyces sp. ISL-1]MBT2388416.1 NifU family protein [Streptomyces sp. ISL-1]
MSGAAATTAAPPRGAATVNAEQAGLRVEEVLDRLAATGDHEVAMAAEELVRVLMDFYGAGLARIVGLLDAPAAKAPGGAPLAGLLGDELVSSLLVLHDLHPEDTATRIARALDSVRNHPVEIVDFDEATGTLRLRSSGGGGCGCPSTGAAVQPAVEDALACYAPEVTKVELESAARSPEPVLLQITTGPPTGTPVRGPASAKAL